MKPIQSILFACAVLLLFIRPTFAGGGPQNVALVVNSQSWASLAVANEFIRLRDIPANHVIYLDHVPNFETIDINTFRDQILTPVLHEIDERHLTPQIDYLIYSSDLPYAVDTSADNPTAKLPNVFTRTASLTAMTYLHERVLAKDISYLQLNVNRYMRWVKQSDDKALTEAEQKHYAEGLGFLAEKEPKYEAALPVLLELAKAHPKNYDILYNLACTQSRLKKYDDAMTTLNASIEAGWFNASHTREDADLVPLRTRQDFKDALAKLEKATVATIPEQGFKSSIAWTPKGEISITAKGEHYLLSTMLAVTSGRGTSVNQALDDLRRAKQSDGTHPKGTIYYMVNGDVRSVTRRWAFPSAVDQLAKLGVKAEILNGNLPMKKNDIMGAMVGISDFDFGASGSTILPGAICEHLTSCGGELTQHRSQTECAAFLRFGAAGTSGAVQEPYALQQKFPTPFIHVHYARGCTLAESFYQSISGPYQLIIIGDPLCAPWSSPPSVTLTGVTAGQVVKGPLSLQASGPNVGSFECFVDGIRQGSNAPDKTFTLDTSAFCDGYHEIEIVGISTERIETQGRATLHAIFQNHGQNVSISVVDKTLTWDRSAKISAQMAGATYVEIFANGHSVGRIAGGSGELDIPARTLGLGTISLQARGYVDEGKTVVAQSEPAILTIDPLWLAAQEKDAGATQKGLHVDFDDATTKIVDVSRNANWLGNAGLKKGHKCTSDAWFEVAADDLYQFQIRTPMTLTIVIDGKVQTTPAARDWRYLPLALKKGWHHLRMTADATTTDPTLDIRFGASGTRSIEGNQFQCVE